MKTIGRDTIISSPSTNTMSHSHKKLKGKDEKKSTQKKLKGTEQKESDALLDDSIDWSLVPDNVDSLKYARDKVTDEFTHKWMIGWSDKAFEPPFPGYSEFLTLRTFVQAANSEVVGALKKWVEHNYDLLDKIEKAVGGEEISKLAFHNQKAFVDYIDTRIINAMKNVNNMPLSVLNDEMLRMLILDRNGREKGPIFCPRTNQAVILVRNMAKGRAFTLRYTPFLDKRNFAITTYWGDYDDEAFAFGKGEVFDYSPNLSQENDV